MSVVSVEIIASVIIIFVCIYQYDDVIDLHVCYLK